MISVRIRDLQPAFRKRKSEFSHSIESIPSLIIFKVLAAQNFLNDCKTDESCREFKCCYYSATRMTETMSERSYLVNHLFPFRKNEFFGEEKAKRKLLPHSFIICT